MFLSVSALQKAANIPHSLAERWFPHISAACTEFDIITPKRLAAFIAQIGHESAGFTTLSESLYYKDPERIAMLFKAGFDLNKNGRVDAAEIEFAKAYTRNSEKLANRAYANRMGNGDEQSGDGYRFRGRGLKQITGRDNYTRCGHALELELIAHPDLLLEDEYAARSAGWFWFANGCNTLADAGDFVGLTRRINGSTTGLSDRQARHAIALEVLCPR